MDVGRSAVVAAFICMLAALFASSAFALPDGRHYEMVSPPYKGGYGVEKIFGAAVADPGEGDRLAFESPGIFAGLPANNIFNSYLAVRGNSGWFTESLSIPATVAPINSPTTVSASLGSLVLVAFPAANTGMVAPQSLEPNEMEYLMQRWDTSGPLVQRIGMSLRRLDGKKLSGSQEGTSSDLCHIVFRIGTASEEPQSEALLPEAKGTLSTLYELVAGDSVSGCGSEAPSLRLVAASNEDGPNGEPKPLDPYCVAYLGGSNDFGDRFNAVSTDGSEIFFTTNANLAKPGCDGGGPAPEPSDPAILFVRLNGERTVQVSKPLANDCKSGPCTTAKQERAEFSGANEAGTRVFFTTREPLATSDTDAALDLYMANIGCPQPTPGCLPAEREVTSLVQVSHDPHSNESAEVQVGSSEDVITSSDGRRAYFVARGVLTNGPNREGISPVKGADNLYVFDVEEGATHFIADLCSGPSQSGGITDRRCPNTLESGRQARNDERVWDGGSQTTGDGQFLLFASYARLTVDDVDAARDLYRYDAQAETLIRVSVGENGYDTDGNNSMFDVESPVSFRYGENIGKDMMNVRAISEDGARIVFATADPLSPNAVNGLVNAYEWHNGLISLVSTGVDEAPLGKHRELVITPSGRDLFFMTVQSLLPEDTDGAVDVYDARLGSGFPLIPASREACSGDACQGPLTNPAPLLVPGSVPQAAGENFVRKTRYRHASARKRSKRHRHKASSLHRHHRARSGRRGGMGR